MSLMSKWKFFIEWKMFGWVSNWIFFKSHFKYLSTYFSFSFNNLIPTKINWIACSYGCLKCFGINANECSTCISPLLLNSTSCVSSLECSNFGYKANDLCLCNFFILIFCSFTYYFKKKLVCDSSCSKCNGPNPTNCVACPESKYLFNGECVNECPLGCYLSENQCQCTFWLISNFKKK